ncbi:hypothetical protein [Pectinatus frisingensis]|uniref:hypothetical protein n=1 Tax=Pectinatus frisingensis TaxID=865 RepID=UPI0018C5099B|nr:hypothetical protein [Pectinatus frisingensis]
MGGICINDLNKKITSLQNLQNKIKVRELKIRNYQHQVNILDKKKHIKNLIAAGKIIEAAGILEIYDPDVLMQLLIKNKNFICKKA